MAVCEFVRYWFWFVARGSTSVGRAEVVAASSREEDRILNNMMKVESSWEVRGECEGDVTSVYILQPDRI